MNEHLPECPTDWCICSYLRACEERVLDAAREAVLALPEYALRDTCASAINLRNDNETPPPLPPSVGVPERRWT